MKLEARPMNGAGYSEIDDVLGATEAIVLSPGTWTVVGLLSLVSIAASAYHGYKRSGGDTGSAIGWGLLGMIFPVITPAVALAQGFGQPR